MANLEKMRIGQRECLLKIDDWFESWRAAYKRGESVNNFVGCIPTRYGKTLIQLAAADAMLEALPFIVGISPALHLRNNVGSEKKYREYRKDYGLSARAFPETLDALPRIRQMLDHRFLSLTTQVVHSQMGNLSEWIGAVVHQHGLPPGFMLDECHGFGERGDWKEIVSILRQHRCPILMFTATLMRGDNTPVYGVEYEELESREVVQTIMGPKHKDPQKFYIDDVLIRYGHYKAKPTYEYTFANAWDERPRVLPELEMVPVSCTVQLVRDGGEVGEEQLLADLGNDVVQKALSNCVRSRKTIRACLETAVAILKVRRRKNPNSRMIVFASPRSKKHDYEVDNSHVRRILGVLKEVANGFTFDALDANDPSASGKLELFCDPESTSALDIVVLKSMGSIGIDSPSCEVVCDLSSRRAYGDWVQRVMRAGTWSGFHTCVLVTPDDGKAKANYKLLTSREPPDTMAMSEVLERLDRRERERDEEDSVREEYVTTGVAKDRSFVDRHGNRGLSDVALRVLDLFPELAEKRSHAEVAGGLRDIVRRYIDGEALEPQDDELVTKAEKLEVRGECGDLTKDIVVQRLNAARQREMHIGEFGEVASAVDSDARKLCKKHYGVELPRFRVKGSPDYDFYSYEQFIALRDTLREMKKKDPFSGKD